MKSDYVVYFLILFISHIATKKNLIYYHMLELDRCPIQGTSLSKIAFQSILSYSFLTETLILACRQVNTLLQNKNEIYDLCDCGLKYIFYTKRRLAWSGGLKVRIL